jgi:transposase
MLDPKATLVRRVEVITGAGGRRRWSDDEKAQAVEASLAPGAVVSHVARRHGVTPQQLFTWRREARRRAEENPGAPFVPAILDAAPATAISAALEPAPPAPVIQIGLNGARVWIWHDADPALTTAVLRALQASISK